MKVGLHKISPVYYEYNKPSCLLQETVCNNSMLHWCVCMQVDYYIEQTLSDNHAVREAACACIAELGSKVQFFSPAVVGHWLPRKRVVLCLHRLIHRLCSLMCWGCFRHFWLVSEIRVGQSEMVRREHVCWIVVLMWLMFVHSCLRGLWQFCQVLCRSVQVSTCLYVYVHTLALLLKIHPSNTNVLRDAFHTIQQSKASPRTLCLGDTLIQEMGWLVSNLSFNC